MALTPIDFPDDPYTGESFTAGNGVTYTWYNNRWNGKVNDVILTVPPEDIELNMLQDVCDDVPADGDVLTWTGTEWCGQEGPKDGVDGVSPTVEVKDTITLPAGQQANVTQNPTATGTELTFSIPKGDKGDAGVGINFKGELGYVGPPTDKPTTEGDMWIDTNGDGWVYEGTEWVDAGPIQGPPGQDGTQVSVGSTITVDSDVPAAVVERDGGDNQILLDFYIPKGEQGEKGKVDGLPDEVCMEDEDATIGRSGGDPVKWTYGRQSNVDFNGIVSFSNIKNGDPNKEPDPSNPTKFINLQQMDNVTFDNLQIGDVLKHAGNNEWVNAPDNEGGGGGDIDLSDYTKRNANEIITKEWQFRDRTVIQGIELLNRINPFDGFVQPAYIDFIDKTSWDNQTNYEVRLQIDDIIYGDGTTRKGLDVIGQGIQIRSTPESTTKTGGINLLPTGIDLWRDDGSEFAHIDFHKDGSDLNGFDCRIAMQDVEYKPGEIYKLLSVRGQGFRIQEHPDEAGTQRSGTVNILPVGIALIRERAHIDFKRSPELTSFDSRITGDPNGNLLIRTMNKMYFQDPSGMYTLQQLIGGSGGGGGAFPGAGYGLYYSGTTLNVGTEITNLISALESRIEALEAIINSGYFQDEDDEPEAD